MVAIGFSGSRKILYEDAVLQVEMVLNEIYLQYAKEVEIITGGCVGVDEIVARVATGLLLNHTVILPEKRGLIDKHWSVYCTKYIEHKGSYKERDAEIVKRSDILFAFPSCDEKDAEGNYTRSGTWMTVRLARQKGIPTIITKVKEK
jgi:hypothetical protein